MNNFISIIIPTLNSDKYLEKCLSALLELDYPREQIEILIVDNGSSDNTVDIAHKFQIQVLQQRNNTIAASRNLGAKHSKGEILAFIDSDCIAPKNWLRDAENILRDKSIGAVGCWYTLPENATYIEKTWDINSIERREKIGLTDWIPSSNFIIRRPLFNKINGFDENLLTSEDYAICQKVREAGLSLFSHPKITIAHLGNPKNLKDFYLKEKWRGVGVFQNFLCHFPEVHLNKAILLALITWIALLGIITGLLILPFNSNSLFVISLILLITVPLGYSIKKTFSTNKWGYLPPLVLLNLVYGLSRAMSLLESQTWKFEPDLKLNTAEKYILFVTPRLPYPINTGAKVRTFNLLKQALAYQNKLILLSFIFEEDEKEHIKYLEKMGIKVIPVASSERIGINTIVKAIFKGFPLSIAKYYNRKIQIQLKRLLSSNRISLVHFDHIHMGQYNGLCRDIPYVIDEHNVEFVILKRMYEKENNPLKKALLKKETEKMMIWEKEKTHKASKIFLVSEKDDDTFRNLSRNGSKTEIIANGVDTEYFKLTNLKSNGSAGSREDNSLVFTGSMDWLPNVDAIQYFCSNILPLIWDKSPAVKLFIVGKCPPEKIKKIGKNDPRILITGTVEDVRPFIAHSKVFVVPLRIGGGTRLKILEAMSMERAIVSTSIGAEGINYTRDRDIIIQDRPNGFAEAVLLLLNDNNKREKLGKKGRELVCLQYDWNIIGSKLNKVYKELRTT